MAKGDTCRIEGCTRIVTIKSGIKCNRHYRLWQKNKSYDEPIKQKLPDGIVKICKKHGNLTQEECYLQGKHREKYQYWYCKKCILDLNLKNKFNLDGGLDDYEKMLASQNNMCELCSCTINNTTRNGKAKRFNVDHNHATGLNRKILCSACNSGLGYFKDSIPVLEKAILYLKTHGVTK